MAVVGVYDWDFFHYEHVIPNLECAKLINYHRQKLNNIAVFTPNLEPEHYTTFYIRKDYEDGVNVPELLLDNVEYGGRAFSENYCPGSMELEMVEPNFSIYEPYFKRYSHVKEDRVTFKKILYATHFRASLDGENLLDFPYERLQKSHAGAILHDYDLASIPHIIDYLKEICNQRETKPYGIGNKFPIQVSSYDELIAYTAIRPIPGLFYMQINGLFSNEEIKDLVERNIFADKQIVWNPAAAAYNQNDFVERVLPIFYKQLLFLRRNNVKFLLHIDNQILKTEELQNLMILLERYMRQGWTDKLKYKTQTLYGYCCCKRCVKTSNYLFRRNFHTLTIDQIRSIFQYIRVNNYEVFDMFYQYPCTKFKGGELVNDAE